MVPLSNSMPTMATQVLSGMHSTRGMESALAENSVRDAYRRHVGGNDGAQDVTANKGQRPVEGDCPICFDELVAGQVGRISEPPAPCTGHAFLGRLKHWQEGNFGFRAHQLPSSQIPCRISPVVAWQQDAVVFCAACGNNVHSECFSRWSAQKRRSSQPVTCIYCRASWAVEDAGDRADGLYTNLKHASTMHAEVSLEGLYGSRSVLIGGGRRGVAQYLSSQGL